MRSAPCCLLVLVLTTACGDDPTPAPIASPLPERTAPAPAAPAAATAAEGDTKAATASAAAEHERAVARTTATVTELLAAAARGDAVAQGKATIALEALGDNALPGLAQALAHEDVTWRRLAAVTLLQWDAMPAGSAAIAALDRARNDPDAAVRAAAEHAWRRATGDTSALDKSRAAHDEAVRLRR